MSLLWPLSLTEMDCPHRHPSLQIIHSKQNGFCWAMLLRFACGTCWAWEMTARDARDSSNELSIFVTIVQHLACESKFSTKKTFTVSIKTPVCIEKEFTLWQFSAAIFCEFAVCHVTLAFGHSYHIHRRIWRIYGHTRSATRTW